jgi:hypothetical protein
VTITRPSASNDAVGYLKKIELKAESLLEKIGGKSDQERPKGIGVATLRNAPIRASKMRA